MLKAIIFDLDGVICSTDEYHYQAWKCVADSMGIYFDRQVNNRLRGVSRMASLEIILEGYSEKALTELEKVQLASRKNDIYRKLLENMGPKDLRVEVRSTLDSLRKSGIKLGIGSSSKNAPYILGRLGLKDYFDAVVDGNNITHSKPDPEVFVKCAELLGEGVEACLVVEDAVSGVQAGHSGGFLVACVGDASIAQAGDFNLSTFSELLKVAGDLA